MPGCRRHPVLQRTGLVDGPGEYLVARALLYRQALAGDRRLVDARLAADHLTVQADALARAHPHQRTEGDLLDVQLTPLAIGVLYGGEVRAQLHQAANSVARAVQRARFDQLGDSEQEHDHGRFRPLANQHRAGHSDAHQRVDIEVAVLQGNPALLVGTQATTEDRHQGNQGNHPGRRQFGEMNRLGTQRCHTCQCQRPPVLFHRCRRSGSFLGGIAQRFSLHAQRGNRLLNGDGVGMGMAHAEDAIDQVELQLLDPRQLAQLVLDQRLLGRAIHGLDAKTAQPRTGATRLAQLHQRRRGVVGTAAVGVFGMFMLGVIMAVLMIVGGFTGGVADRLVHGFILKCPVAK
ncbi:hypothetical protein D3C78_813040 [compost metagenome]